MQDHTANSDLIHNDIPEMIDAPLGETILAIAAERLARDAADRATFAAALQVTDGSADGPAVARLMELLADPQPGTVDVEGLQWLGSALMDGRGQNLPFPETFPTQSQWNRLLRDNGERLRAASLTLGAGRTEIATEQLAPVVQFLGLHFVDLPRTKTQSD